MAEAFSKGVSRTVAELLEVKDLGKKVPALISKCESPNSEPGKPAREGMHQTKRGHDDASNGGATRKSCSQHFEKRGLSLYY
jgi:hypothetical protein